MSQPQQSDSQISIRVCSADGNETFFKIRKHTPLRKLMDAYCQKHGLSRDAVRFTFDGNRISDDATAESLGIENDESIDCLIEQTGGISI